MVCFYNDIYSGVIPFWSETLNMVTVVVFCVETVQLVDENVRLL